MLQRTPLLQQVENLQALFRQVEAAGGVSCVAERVTRAIRGER